MLDKILVGLSAFIGFVVFYRVFVEPRIAELDYHRQMNNVLSKDEYKVKGRFE